jgi:RNA polymerase sigma-70 factor (ECF subfamily)
MVRGRSRQIPLSDMETVLRESRPDPHREHSASELREWLRAAISNLNPTAAEMFVLRYIEGYGNRDIARMLDTSQHVVAVTLFRARSRLRKSMRKFLGGS